MKSRPFIVIILLAILLFPVHRALAIDAVVGDGTPASCSEGNFDSSLMTVQAGGGTLTFDCGGAAVILFSSQKVITANVTIQGGGQITLNGGNNTRIFYVASGAALTLQGITLLNGYAADNGGAIQNDGALTLLNATIRASTTDVNHSGGAIVSTGPLTITDSLLEDNHGGNGGALFLRWELGDAVITNTTLRNNSTIGTDRRMGGAILLWDGADVSLHGSRLESNLAGGYGEGGGIHNQFANSSITLDSGSWISDNTANFYGGGIYNSSGTVSLADATLSGNSATIYDGGGIFNSSGAVSLTNVMLNDNSVGIDGGGLYNINNGLLALNNVTLSSNSATSGGGIYNSSIVNLTNVTLSGNSAAFGGGIFHYIGTASLTNVTLSGNSAAEEGGGVFGNGGALTLKNVVLAQGASGANCAGGGITSAGFNLSSDTSCGLNQAGDQVSPDLRLGPLAYNGGSTPTHLPTPDSPAIDTGTSLGAPATDQRGLPRPSGLATDKGAVERQPVEGMKVYLPLVIK